MYPQCLLHSLSSCADGYVGMGGGGGGLAYFGESFPLKRIPRLHASWYCALLFKFIEVPPDQ